MIELTLQHQHKHSENEEKCSDQQCSDEEHQMKQFPCHPHRPAAKFDFSAIEEQIKIIRRKKEEAKEAARKMIKHQKSDRQVYETDIIEEALQESMDLVPEHISLALKHRVKFIQDKVYIGMQSDGGSGGSLVERIKKEVLSNQALGNELNLMMAELHIGIENDIEQGVYEVHNVVHKPKFIPVEPEPAHRVKLKNMLIKSKIMDLRQQFNKSEVASQNMISPTTSSVNPSNPSKSPTTSSVDPSKFVNRNEGEIWGDEFHLLSEGTKKAQQFIKKVQQQQFKIRQERSKKKQQQKSVEVKSAMEHRQFEEQMRKQKHESLRKRYEEGRKNKSIQKQKQQEKQMDYIKFMKQYRGKKPLFKIKEEQFQHNVIEEQEKRRKLQLQQIHSAKRPLTLEELQQHQKNYQKLKDEKISHQNAQREFRQKQIENLPKKNYYRGKFHSLVMAEKEQKKIVIDPMIAKEDLLKRQRQFGQFVRKKYAPLISEAKRKQLDELTKSLDAERGRKGLSAQQYKQLGNKYLKELHKMIEELRAKGLVKSTISQEEAPKKRDYLKEVRQKYNFSTMDYSSQLQSNQQWVINKAKQLQKQAKHRQKVLIFKSQDQFDLQHYMKELNNIHEDYIKSAQAKISLINKLQGRRSTSTARYSLTDQ